MSLLLLLVVCHINNLDKLLSVKHGNILLNQQRISIYISFVVLETFLKEMNKKLVTTFTDMLL